MGCPARIFDNMSPAWRDTGEKLLCSTAVGLRGVWTCVR